MTTDPSTIAASAAGESTTSAGSSADVSTDTTTVAPIDTAAGAPAPAAAIAPAYVPNYKYKAAFQEKELDQFWHPLIKDADSEKKVKEIFNRADAHDFQKEKREYAEKQYSGLLNDFGGVTQTVQRFNDAVAKKDLGAAFRLGNINSDDVLRWALKEVQMREAPPEQRQQYEQFQQAQSQKNDLEEKVSFMQQQYEQQAVQTRTMQLDMALQRPEVASFAEAWDRNADAPGAFRHFVMEEAKKVYYDSGKDLSAEDAVNQVVQKFGKFLNGGNTSAQPSNTTAPQHGVPQAMKPVIPSITGKAASPVKKVPRNLDDLKKLIKEKSG